MNCSTPGLPVHHQHPEFTQIHIHQVIQPSSHLILCRPLLLLPQILPSIRVFSNEPSLRIRWPKYWSFSLSIIPSKEHPGLISFRMDWLDLLAVQGTLKSLLQHHGSKASILRRSAFFTVQPSNSTPGHTSGENHNSKRYMHPNIYCSTIYNNRTGKQPKCPLTEEWDGISLNHKKEWACAIFRDIDRLRDYLTEWSKSEIEK